MRTWAVGLALLLGNLFWNINSSVYIYFIYIVITWFLKSRENFIRTITEYRKKNKNIKKFKKPDDGVFIFKVFLEYEIR